MLRIRLTRVGKKKQPSYRLVVADQRSPRDGAFVKIIGHYNPRTNPTTLVVDEDEAIEWLKRGAQPSETAGKLLTRIGVMERAGRPPVTWDRKAPPKPKETAEEPAQPAAAEAPAQPTAEEAPAEEPEAEEPKAEKPKAKGAKAKKAKGEPEAAAQGEPEQAEPQPEGAAQEPEAESETEDES